MLISFLPIQLKLPDSNHAEVSLFGPGIGECIVLHIGEGRWFIIDSCLCPDTKQPIALEYLNSLGVNVALQVCGILITHWHSDHIEGAFSLLKACENAKLYHTAALSSNEAFYLASLYKKDLFANSDRDIREFSEIIDYLFQSKDPTRLVPVIARHTFFDFREVTNTRMVALSPSPIAVTQAIAKIVDKQVSQGSDRMRSVVPISENLNAVAIHFSFGEFSILLGSDLEETGNIYTGWSAVINSQIANELSLSQSSVYKVAHHGSETGHHNDIWNVLLENSPLSIATPFSRCGLPTPENIERINDLSSDFLVTRDPKANKKTKRDSMVEREMKAITKNRKTINDKMGHIQIRTSGNGELNVATNSSCVSCGIPRKN